MAEMDSPDEADRDDAQTANTEAMPSAGEEAPRTRGEVPDEMRGLRRAPRRVDIRREGGSYTIHFGGRNLASFCEEFSEITGYSMPPNTRQQVYITVEGIGQVRDWEETPEFTRALAQQQEDQVQAERVDAPDLSEASLERLLARTRPVPETRDDREDPPSRPEPRLERGGALARSMNQPSEDWRREVYSRLHREIGQCSEMLRLLERL